MDCTSPLWRMKCGQRCYTVNIAHAKGHLWLGNKTPRTRWYRVDLPVLLLASSVAWLRSGFLRAEWEGVCLCACERRYPRVCLSVWMLIPWPCKCDGCQVFLTCSVRAERSCCISVCVLLRQKGCWSVYVSCLYVFVLNKHHLWKAHRVCFALGLCHGKAALLLPCVHVFTFVGLCARFGRRKPRRAASTERPMCCPSGGCVELQADAEDCPGRCVFQLTRAEGRDVPAPHAETDAVKTMRAGLAKHSQHHPSKPKHRSQHVDQSTQSSGGRRQKLCFWGLKWDLWEIRSVNRCYFCWRTATMAVFKVKYEQHRGTDENVTELSWRCHLRKNTFPLQVYLTLVCLRLTPTGTLRLCSGCEGPWQKG